MLTKIKSVVCICSFFLFFSHAHGGPEDENRCEILTRSLSEQDLTYLYETCLASLKEKVSPGPQIRRTDVFTNMMDQNKLNPREQRFLAMIFTAFGETRGVSRKHERQDELKRFQRIMKVLDNRLEKLKMDRRLNFQTVMDVALQKFQFSIYNPNDPNLETILRYNENTLRADSMKNAVKAYIQYEHQGGYLHDMGDDFYHYVTHTIYHNRSDDPNEWFNKERVRHTPKIKDSHHIFFAGLHFKGLYDPWVSPTPKNDKNDTLSLILAIKRGDDRESIRLLLENGADPNIQDDKYQQTALIWASDRGNTDAVELLLEYKANPSMKDYKHNTPLIFASDKGYSEIVQMLLKHGADVNVKNHNKNTPLIFAAAKGHFQIVQTLLKNHAHVNAKNDHGNTALIFASDKGHLDVALILLEHGADGDMKNDNGHTALDFASFKKYRKIQQLLERPPDRNKDKNDTLSLILAIKRGADRESIRLLLENGADPNIQDDEYQQTALMWASDRGNTDAVELLLEYEANPSMKDYNHNTPLIFASDKGHSEIVQMLLKHGANVKVKNHNKNTPLIFAAAKGHFQIVQTLLENHAHVNAKNYRGNTALIFASDKGHPDIAQILLDHGADRDMKNNDGHTALNFASFKKYRKIQQLLEQHPRDINKDAHRERENLDVSP